MFSIEPSGLTMTLDKLEGHFNCSKHTRGIQYCENVAARCSYVIISVIRTLRLVIVTTMKDYKVTGAPYKFCTIKGHLRCLF